MQRLLENLAVKDGLTEIVFIKQKDSQSASLLFCLINHHHQEIPEHMQPNRQQQTFGFYKNHAEQNA